MERRLHQRMPYRVAGDSRIKPPRKFRTKIVHIDGTNAVCGDLTHSAICIDEVVGRRGHVINPVVGVKLVCELQKALET